MASPKTAPILHIRPTRGWLNDPNGVTCLNGRWHVFFQHNPERAQHAAIQWGHVSSADLATWTEHPVAFTPQPAGPDQGGCWSGSFLPWGPPSVAYTGLLDGPANTTICVRYAEDDDLESWTDPVVVATQPGGIDLVAMRDPAPFQWGDRHWAVLGAGMTDGTPSLLLYSCDDPRRWSFEGVWLDLHDPVVAAVAPADMWECPQLVPLGDRWILVLSLQTAGVLQDVVYLLGDLREDPTQPGRPRFVPSTGGLFDHGPDFYAPQVVDDGHPQLLVFGWIREQDAASDASDDEVAGCLTLPRRLGVDAESIHVTTDPAVEALVVHTRALTCDGGPAGPGADRWGAASLPAQSRCDVRGVSSGSTVDLQLSGGNERIIVTADDGGCEIWLDGEVVEVYHHRGIAQTYRRPGVAFWTVSFPPGSCEITVATLG